MGRSTGWVLIVAGGALALFGIGMALLQFSNLYNGVLEKPLDQPEGFEKETAGKMLRYAIIAAPGGVCVIVGKMMLKRAKARERGGR